MSFKREGDDPAQLGVLQKRRVAELLASYIPEDEALLLRSGRYACTVCAHRPVFDTLDVLTVHRAGKKHTGSLQRFYGRKRAAQGQRHEEEAQAEAAGAEGSAAPLLARTRRIARSALLKAAPYSSCCRRRGGKQLASRRRLDGAERCPDASGAVAEGRRSRGRQPCSPAAGAPRRASGRSDGGSGPHAARQQRKSLLIGPGPARSPQPRATPGPGAVPAAAERWLDPGPLRQVGEGRERRIRLGRGGAAHAAAGLKPPAGPGPPPAPQPLVIEAAAEAGGV
ncbi:sodium channel modifier 1 isoform X1 [Opisthocomus hoazin]|uniref:sodium channel modifier 1 isoform X1 n=1 Tax=Opisthocomus hoazin TaxID=30419 RepID=UPI003F53B93B